MKNIQMTNDQLLPSELSTYNPTTQYPYVVWRRIATVYNQIPVKYVPTVQIRPFNCAITIVDPNPFDDNCSLNNSARRALEEIISLQCVEHHLRMCVVFNEKDCVYCEPDGSRNKSNCIPNGGV